MILPSLLVAAAILVQVEAGTFDATDYGARGDAKTDNTDAFAECVEALIEAGGGRMYIPDGIYRGRITIPGTKNWITVEIVGESEPTPVFGTIAILVYPLIKGAD